MKRPVLHLLILMAFLPFLHGCEKYPENPIRPYLPYPITILPSETHYFDPSTNLYHDLNFVSEWVYLTADIESTSRGIIVYRQSETEFLAYDRLPPNYPDACTDSHGNTTRLVVDFPFVVDRCNNAYYNILDGQIIIGPNMIPVFETDEQMIYPLIQYHTQFDGHKLTVYN